MLDLKRLVTKVQKTLRDQRLSATTGVNIVSSLLLADVLKMESTGQ